MLAQPAEQPAIRCILSDLRKLNFPLRATVKCPIVMARLHPPTMNGCQFGLFKSGVKGLLDLSHQRLNPSFQEKESETAIIRKL
jgi:hypothetical protein